MHTDIYSMLHIVINRNFTFCFSWNTKYEASGHFTGYNELNTKTTNPDINLTEVLRAFPVFEEINLPKLPVCNI